MARKVTGRRWWGPLAGTATVVVAVGGLGYLWWPAVHVAVPLAAAVSSASPAGAPETAGGSSGQPLPGAAGATPTGPVTVVYPQRSVDVLSRPGEDGGHGDTAGGPTAAAGTSGHGSETDDGGAPAVHGAPAPTPAATAPGGSHPSPTPSPTPRPTRWQDDDAGSPPPPRGTWTPRPTPTGTRSPSPYPSPTRSDD